MIETPCKKCTKDTGRYPGCHGKCKKYLRFREEWDRKKETEKKAREAYYCLGSNRQYDKWNPKPAK